jgi:hypothetical protein
MKKRPIRIEGDIAYVPLPCGKEALIDADDAKLIGQHNWSVDAKGYVRTTKSLNGKRECIKIHRLIMQAMADVQVDHIDSNKLDNRKEKLRFATNAQNGCNRGANVNNKSGFKGVSLHKRDQQWQAYIQHNGKSVYLGLFTTPELAHQAYCKASAELHKEFGRTA